MNIGKFVYYIKGFIFLVREYLSYWYKPLTLDIHAAEHCNLNCVGCNHYSPIANPEFCDLEQLERSLAKLSVIQNSFGVIRLMGGEPLLNPNIISMMYIVRNYLKNIRIELVTNGILLLSEKRLSNEFWAACRQNDVSVCITKYPVSLDYKKMKDICQKHHVQFRIFADRTEDGNNAFYSFCIDPDGGAKKIMKFVRCGCSICLQLVGNRIYSCPTTAYVSHLNKAFDCNFQQQKGDFVEVDKLKFSFQVRWLTCRPKPFCFYCGSGGELVDWKQSERKPEEWIVYSNKKR